MSLVIIKSPAPALLALRRRPGAFCRAIQSTLQLPPLYARTEGVRTRSDMSELL